jgi:Transposase IS200 like
MPRHARLALPNVPLHLIQRGNRHQACFFTDEDYRFYLDWLTEHTGKTGCRVHAYGLMTNHVHLLITVERARAAGALIEARGQRDVHPLTGAAGPCGRDVSPHALSKKQPICWPASLAPEQAEHRVRGRSAGVMAERPRYRGQLTFQAHDLLSAVEQAQELGSQAFRPHLAL